MDQQTISTSIAPEVDIEKVAGSLQIKGWERSEVSIWANPADLKVDETDDTVHIRCDGNCTVRLPYGASLQVGSVDGEARLKLLEDPLTIDRVSGALSLRNVGDAAIRVVNGELQVKHLSGNISVEKVDGDARVRDVQGRLLLGKVNGDADIQDVEGEVQLSADGDARLRLSSLCQGNYRITASGSVVCKLPFDADLRVVLASGGQNIMVKTKDGQKLLKQPAYSFVLGSGAGLMEISAGGSISFMSQEVDWPGVSSSETVGEANFTDFGRQISREVEAQVESITRQINDQMANMASKFNQAGFPAEMTDQMMQQVRRSSEHAQERAQEKIRRSQEKLERKMETARRREDSRAQAAERRPQGRGRRPWTFEWLSQQPTSEEAQPVSEEERLMVLRMLEQKKISIDEAEKLLAALEGKEEK